jgi:glycosyltransferase involved in cell wall biosynthesis
VGDAQKAFFLFMEAFRPSLLIPHYNHHQLVGQVISKLEPVGLALIIVDDGSDATSVSCLLSLIKGVEWIHLLRHPDNLGKGAAVRTGLEYAYQNAYTHVLQIDADGQHAIGDVPKLLAMAKKQPRAIISGLAIFGKEAPLIRRYGRRITNTLANVETLSLTLRDTMCGFRVYPITETIRLLQRHPMGHRMAFDTEVLVKACWARIEIHYISTLVTYPQSGISHFHYWRDNVILFRMHCRLLLGMFFRIPRLLFRARNTCTPCAPD